MNLRVAFRALPDVYVAILITKGKNAQMQVLFLLTYMYTLFFHDTYNGCKSPVNLSGHMFISRRVSVMQEQFE